MSVDPMDPPERQAKTAAGTQLSSPQGVTSGVSSAALSQEMPAAARHQASAAGAMASRPASRATLELLSDAEVMLRVAAGDDSAFDYLVEKFRRPLISFMYRMAHNQTVAEDLAQDVFLRVYRSRHTYAAEAKFTTWLYRIATNLAVNYARDSRQDRATASLDEPDPETGTTIDVADPSLTVEQDMLRRERLAEIRRQVEALPQRQRLAVIMHKYQGMDYRQIAEVLKLSESATKSLLFRAYETLRETLKKYI